jgi:hypothetical protein
MAQGTPDVVVVNLGANDFAAGDPGPDFLASYTSFLARIRAAYPKTVIVACLGTSLSDAWPVGRKNRTKARSYITGAIASRHASGDDRVSFFEFAERNARAPLGCDFHPALASHREMGEQLVGYLRTLMAW